MAAQGTIIQRHIRRVIQVVPALRIDAVNERIGVVARLAYEGEHFAVVRINRNQCTAVVAKGIFGDFLQLCIDAQYQRVAGNRGSAGYHTHCPPPRIHFDLLYARGTVQIGFVTLLQSGLADVIRTAIIGRQIIFFQLVGFFIIDAPDIAEQMGHLFTVRIVAKQPRLDFYSGETILLRGEARDFLVAQAAAYHQRFKVVALGKQFFETLAILVGDCYQCGQIVYRSLDIGSLVLVYLQRIAGIVARQNNSVAVEYQAAIWNNGDNGDTVAFRQSLVIAVEHRLQIEETQQQNGQQHRHKTDADDQSQLEVVNLALIILELNALLHVRLLSALFCLIARNMMLSGIHSNVEVRQPRKYCHTT